MLFIISDKQSRVINQITRHRTLSFIVETGTMSKKVQILSVLTLVFFTSTVILTLQNFLYHPQERVNWENLEPCLCNHNPTNNRKCPQKPIVTVRQIGRLGNQMWEYASVWLVSKSTGREPFVPICIKHELEEVFNNITLPSLSEIAHCDIKNPISVTHETVLTEKGNILLPNYAQMVHHVMHSLKEVLKMFTFRKKYLMKSKKILRKASKGIENCTYVSVHVRRTDYEVHLMLKNNMSLLTRDFYLRHMTYFRRKYGNVRFMVLSDDIEWCRDSFTDKDVTIVKTYSPAQDLAVMASCNHTIMDYGTFGLWGALMAGGETFLYNLKEGTEFKVASFMSWNLST